MSQLTNVPVYASNGIQIGVATVDDATMPQITITLDQDASSTEELIEILGWGAIAGLSFGVYTKPGN